jgi:hypothetical protein
MLQMPLSVAMDKIGIFGQNTHFGKACIWKNVHVGKVMWIFHGRRPAWTGLTCAGGSTAGPSIAPKGRPDLP